MIQKKFKALLFKDNRGYLAEITPKEINRKFIYSILTNSKKNVIRGMHYNKKKEEEKLVYVLDGEILDVTVNLNKGKNFGKINYTKLKKNDILYLPKGFAHGYKCLGKSNTVLYLLTQKYSAKNNHGFIWNDQNFKIKWEIKNPILSNRDKNFKEYLVK
jgi:dTDP-4-dehydrorhamnose 3,5-epimerase